MKKVTGIFILIILLVILCTIGYFIFERYMIGLKPVACTTEAKICPDGSSVGRIAPNCDFAPCPDISAGWETYKDVVNGIEMKYPATFAGAVWRAQTWPPTVSVLSGKENADEACSQISSGSIPFTFIANKNIGSNSFALLENSDAGAGQLYTDYCYVLSGSKVTQSSRNYVINFVIHSTNGCGSGNCGPYCGTPNEQACKNFDMQKEVVVPIEQVISTFKLTN